MTVEHSPKSTRSGKSYEFPPFPTTSEAPHTLAYTLSTLEGNLGAHGQQTGPSTASSQHVLNSSNLFVDNFDALTENESPHAGSSGSLAYASLASRVIYHQQLASQATFTGSAQHVPPAVQTQ